MKAKWFLLVALVAIGVAVYDGFAVAPVANAATLPPGNAAQQWNKIAEDTIVGAGAFQGEGFIYLAYVSAAMDGAVSPGERRGQSADAAVSEAAYDVLVHYFPSNAANLTALHEAALAAVPDGPAKRNGINFGALAAGKVIRDRAGDGLQTPVGTSSPFPTLPFVPGVWRLTPPGYVAPQTPWMGQVRPFILDSADQFMPGPPPALQSQAWVDAFNQVKSLGSATSTTRTAEQTTTAIWWTANVNRQYNGAARSIATSMALDVPETARLLVMVNEVAADAMISMFDAKYRYVFWRPVTAIDPTSVHSDGFGPMPGFDDGNPLTVEQPGWHSLITTPNHPEYPSAHSTVSAAIAEVFARYLGTDAIDLTLLGGPGVNVPRTFATPHDLIMEVQNARVWGGVHYRFSAETGAKLGQQVATYDLDHGFANGH